MRDEKYRRWIASLPCCICLGIDVQAAHVKYLAPEQRGMSQKVSDEFAVPLCVKHHREQELSKVGEKAWWKEQRANPKRVTDALWEIYERFTKEKDDSISALYYAEDFLRFFAKLNRKTNGPDTNQ
ncbi:MAG: hypothetical protein O2797_02535 [Bacteroidetes bacterium]|nr:hypothetical protein [Bacteroidota bacterium]